MKNKNKVHIPDPQEEHEQKEKETADMITAEDSVEVAVYLANAPDCCSGKEQLDHIFGMLGANVMDDEIYHNSDEHPKMEM